MKVEIKERRLTAGNRSLYIEICSDCVPKEGTRTGDKLSPVKNMLFKL